MRLNHLFKTASSKKCPSTKPKASWEKYSDNYIAATAKNGNTVLASKSATELFIGLEANNKPT